MVHFNKIVKTSPLRTGVDVSSLLPFSVNVKINLFQIKNIIENLKE